MSDQDDEAFHLIVPPGTWLTPKGAIKSAVGESVSTYDEAAAFLQQTTIGPWRSIWRTLWTKDRVKQQISPAMLLIRLALFGVMGSYGASLLRFGATRRYDGALLLVGAIVTITSSILRNRDAFREGERVLSRMFFLILGKCLGR